MSMIPGLTLSFETFGDHNLIIICHQGLGAGVLPAVNMSMIPGLILSFETFADHNLIIICHQGLGAGGWGITRG